jgi:hypothetical protein
MLSYVGLGKLEPTVLVNIFSMPNVATYMKKSAKYVP